MSPTAVIACAAGRGRLAQPVREGGPPSCVTNEEERLLLRGQSPVADPATRR